MSNKKEWWEKPGLGVMYQIEARPGWLWNRNYDKFNASMRDENGNFNFNGPLCKMIDWVEFSKKIGLDYHIFEVKWHDGICWWNTKYTNWKTPEDYTRIFAEESKKDEIPFMFYYSSIFDHNPQFDDIQPLRSCTPSFICMHRKKGKRIARFSLLFTYIAYIAHRLKRFQRKIPYDEKVKYLDDVRYDVFTNNPKKYEVYMFKQLIELIETYKPDGMWIDWFMWNIESSAHMIMEFMKKRYPNTVLTFNNSVHSRLKWAHYTSYEAHDINTAWKRGNKYRNKMRPWELVGPAASDWDNPRPRADPYEAARIAVIIMASGGKFAFGMPSQMNGDLYEQPSKQLEVFGKWYKKRKEVFTEAVPMQYKGKKVPGVKVSDKSIGIIGSIFKKDNILHLIYRYSVKKKDLLVEFSHKKWENIDKIFLVPSERELKLRKFEKKLELTLPKEYVDRIDTILKIKMK